jgi:hypothetical protein
VFRIVHLFTNFIVKHKSKYIQFIFQDLRTKFPEKYEAINMHCDNIDKLHELLCEQFLTTLFTQNEQ